MMGLVVEHVNDQNPRRPLAVLTGDQAAVTEGRGQPGRIDRRRPVLDFRIEVATRRPQAIEILVETLARLRHPRRALLESTEPAEVTEHQVIERAMHRAERSEEHTSELQ